MKIFSKSKTSEPEVKAIDEPAVEPEVAPEAPVEEETPSEIETLKAEMLDAIKMAKDEILEAIKALTEEEEVETPSEPAPSTEETEAEKAKAIAEAAINILGEAGYAPLELKESNANASSTVSRDAFNAMSPRQKSEFSKNGGRIN